jgi:hypothetical protein
MVAHGVRSCKESPEVLVAAHARRRRDLKTRDLFSASQCLGGKEKF